MQAAIYVRQSLDKSGEGAAVDRQLDACHELAAQHGWQVAEVYRDNDASATKGPRPEWERLLGDLGAGRHDAVLCWHTDRLYRRSRDVVSLLEIAERRSLRIVSVKAGDLDLSTPTGRYFAGQLAGMARYEVEQKGDRQKAANRQRAQHGVSLWTRRPFGFDRDGNAVRIVDSEAAEIRTAAARVLKGDPMAQVVADFNLRGVPTSTGSAWTVTSLRRILLNPRVAGRVQYRGEDMGLSGFAILDADTADRLAAFLGDPRRKNAPSTQVKYLLSGLALCGRDTCADAPMYATTNGADRVPVYRCRVCYGARRRDRVDEVIMGAVVARLSRPDAVYLLREDVDVAAIRNQVVELRDRRDGLAAMLADGLLTSSAVRVQAKRLAAQIEGLERQIDAATGTSPLADVVSSGDVDGALEALPILRLREVIRTLIEIRILPAGKGVRFSPSQVRIDWLSP